MTALTDPTRLRALRGTRLLSDPVGEGFDALARLARETTGAPMGLLSVIDDVAQHRLGASGFDPPPDEVPLEHSICRLVVEAGAPLAVEDAREDERLRAHPAHRRLGVRAYAGVPLREPGGQVVGSVCAMATESRAWSATDLAALGDLAEVAAGEIARRLAEAEAERSRLALGRAEAQLAALLDAAPLMFFAMDPDGRITHSQGRALQAIGLKPGEAVGRNVLDYEPDTPVLELGRRGLPHSSVAEFEGLVLETRFTPVMAEDGTFEGIVGVAIDITELREREARMAHLAYFDQVTGLPNRLRLEEEVDAALESCGTSCMSALLCLDLDDYKTVNDSLGHAAGDHVLREVARRLEAAVGDGPSLARLTGDSFLVFLAGLGAGSAEAVARQVLGAFSLPFEVDGVEFQLGATVGVSVAHCGGIGFGEHLRRSEAAMYRAKRSAPGTHAHYEPEADDPRARLTMTARLRRALDRGELTLHYQPIYTLPGRVPSALEALLRWEDPVSGTVSPAEFIPAAEASGLIGEIGAWVADAACRQLAEWTRMGFGVAVGFNVSPVQLQSERFVDILRATIERHDVEPGLLIAEITESVAMEDVARTTSVLRSLADTGVGLVIDDFGAGHSSLTRLRGLPVSSMKIDRALMHGIDTDPGAAAVVRATLALAQALGIRTVAEGVETEAQLGVLVGAGCAYAQGFLLARPMPAEAATRLLADALAPTSAS